MRAGIVVNVTPADRRRLEAIVADRSAPQKHVWRAKISSRPPTVAGQPRSCGDRASRSRWSGDGRHGSWRKGLMGLRAIKTRKPGKPPLPPATVQQVLDFVLGPPPREATHWTGRTLAKAAGISLRSVQRILEAHQLAPHRIRTFKNCRTIRSSPRNSKTLSAFYVDPPAHAVVLSVDEKRSHGVGGDRRSGRVRLLPDSLWRRPMQIVTDRPQVPTAIRTDLGAIFVSLELSRSTWLITSLSPGGGEKMSKHTVRSGDVAGTLRRRSSAQYSTGTRSITSARFCSTLIRCNQRASVWPRPVCRSRPFRSHRPTSRPPARNFTI